MIGISHNQQSDFFLTFDAVSIVLLLRTFFFVSFIKLSYSNLNKINAKIMYSFFIYMFIDIYIAVSMLFL